MKEGLRKEDVEEQVKCNKFIIDTGVSLYADRIAAIRDSTQLLELVAESWPWEDENDNKLLDAAQEEILRLKAQVERLQEQAQDREQSYRSMASDYRSLRGILKGLAIFPCDFNIEYLDEVEEFINDIRRNHHKEVVDEPKANIPTIPLEMTDRKCVKVEVDGQELYLTFSVKTEGGKCAK